MTCIKTGANIWIAERYKMLHGDVFQVDGVYIFRANTRPVEVGTGDVDSDDLLEGNDEPVHFVIKRIAHSFDNGKVYSTIIAEVSYCECYGYGGVLFKSLTEEERRPGRTY